MSTVINFFPLPFSCVVVLKTIKAYFLVVRTVRKERDIAGLFTLLLPVFPWDFSICNLSLWCSACLTMILGCPANLLPLFKQGFQVQWAPENLLSKCVKLAFSPLQNYFSNLTYIQLNRTPAIQQEPNSEQTKLRIWLTVALESKLSCYDWSLMLRLELSPGPHAEEKDVLCSGFPPCLIAICMWWASGG